MILRETCHKFKETHAQDIKKSTPEKPPSPQTRAAENEIIKVQDIINRLKTGEARASKKLRGSNANRVIQFAQPVSPHFFPRPLKKKIPRTSDVPRNPKRRGGEGEMSRVDVFSGGTKHLHPSSARRRRVGCFYETSHSRSRWLIGRKCFFKFF